MFKIDSKKLKIDNKRIIKNKKPTTINITGDWTPFLEEVSNLMVKRKERYYGNLSSYFEKGDLNITNLETVIDIKSRKFNKSAPKIINKPQVLSSLKSINTNLVCLANNHIMDNGVSGLKNTIKYLKKYKINYVGAGFSQREIYNPFLFKKNKQKIAIINTSEGEESNEKYNNNIGASFIESYKVIDQIRFYKSKGYLVILISHAGVEFIPTPPPYIKEIYKNFVNEGADLVVGHHPHVPQGFEIYKNAAIFYSIGNFTVWRQNLRKNCYHSFFLNLNIQDNKIANINLIPYQFSKNGVELIPKSDFNKNLVELNNLLLKSNKIWKEYLFRKKSTGGYFLESLSYLYNYYKYKNDYLHKYKTLSKKYIDLDYLQNNYQSDPKYKYILDRWEIKYEYNFLSVFKDIFKSLYIIMLIFKKIIKNIKSLIFK